MPRIKEHIKTSSSIGAISAGVWSHKHGDNAFEIICSILGGYVGGKVAAGWPDVIDRPTSPNHRSIGHGILPNFVLVKSQRNNFFVCLNALQKQVDDFKKNNTLQYIILAFVSKFIWGFIIGIVFGYGTHLLTDFSTDRGLPIIC